MNVGYEYDLTNKQSIFLWLYQVLPNIDIIHHIYNYKETLEYEDTLIYYGVLPEHIRVVGIEYKPPYVKTLDSPNGYILSMFINSQMRLNHSFIRALTKPGFICTFTFNQEDYDSVELTEINNGNWVSVIPYINESPCLKDKLRCIHSILENEPYFIETIGQILDKYVKLYENNSIVRLGIDQNNNYYLPLF